MWLLIGTVFVASLLGSLHCVGMCGPFALLAASNSRAKRSALIPSIAYSAGRLVTYSLVGFVFGALGLALNLGTSFNHWQQTATTIAGILMVVIGLIALARYLGLQVKLPKLFTPVQKVLGAGFAKTKQLPPIARAFSIGTLTSLMPCGWLYTFAIAAAGTGSPIWGMLVMVSFWAGTVPVLIALVLGIDRIGKPIQKRLPAMMAGLVIAIGLFTIFLRAPVAIAGDEKVNQQPSETIKQIHSINHDELSCCNGK